MSLLGSALGALTGDGSPLFGLMGMAGKAAGLFGKSGIQTDEYRTDWLKQAYAQNQQQRQMINTGTQANLASANRMGNSMANQAVQQQAGAMAQAGLGGANTATQALAQAKIPVADMLNNRAQVGQLHNQQMEQNTNQLLDVEKGIVINQSEQPDTLQKAGMLMQDAPNALLKGQNDWLNYRRMLSGTSNPLGYKLG
jgi:hypothetical protein